HSLSSCFKDLSEKTVLGYALDGFPITGPMMATNKYLTTDDLDECHGITSDITIDGKTVTTYHYVMTQDFPYSASCFRSHPSSSSGQGQGSGQQDQMHGRQGSAHEGSQQQGSGQHQEQSHGGQGQTPHQEAITACTGKS